MIGKFEELVLLALIRTGPNSLASDVFEKLEEVANKEFKFGALYTTLDRMATKKWVSLKEQKPANGGKKRRYFSITAQGQRALSESLSTTNSLARGLNVDLMGA
jgi:DNA-binding PadR family transcriptional regulator